MDQALDFEIACMVNPHAANAIGVNLRLHMKSHDGNSMSGFVALESVSQESPSVRYPAMFRWTDVHQFVRELDAAHRNLRGSAILKDWDAIRVLCISVLDHGSGQFVAGGTLTSLLLHTSDHCRDDPCREFSHCAMNATYDGLVFDQSYLPSVISQTSQYVNQGLS